jgi:hypothetical protein
MRKLSMIFVMLGLVAATASVARAQGVDLRAQGGNIFVGYSFEQDNVQSGVGLHGYNASGTFDLNRKIAIEANFAGHHGNTVIFSQSAPVGAVTQKDDIFTYVFGPKLTHVIGPSNNFELFGHFLIGGSNVHSSSQNSGAFGGASSSASGSGFAFVTGGGLDWFRGTWGIRILEVDFVRTSSITMTSSCGGTCVQKATGDSANNFRFSTGLLLHWGN